MKLSLWKIEHKGNVDYVAAYERGDVVTWSINDWARIFCSSDHWIGPTDDLDWNWAFGKAIKCVSDSTIERLSVKQMRDLKVLNEDEDRILNAKILLEDYVEAEEEIPGLVFDEQNSRILDEERMEKELFNIRDYFQRGVEEAIKNLFERGGFLPKGQLKLLGLGVLKEEFDKFTKDR